MSARTISRRPSKRARRLTKALIGDPTPPPAVYRCVYCGVRLKTDTVACDGDSDLPALDPKYMIQDLAA